MASIVRGELSQPPSCDLHWAFCPLWHKWHRDTQESGEQGNQTSKGLLTRKTGGRTEFHLMQRMQGRAEPPQVISRGHSPKPAGVSSRPQGAAPALNHNLCELLQPEIFPKIPTKPTLPALLSTPNGHCHKRAIITANTALLASLEFILFFFWSVLTVPAQL